MGRDDAGGAERRPEVLSRFIRTLGQTPSRQWLFFSDTYYPGWHAWVDGKEEKIVKANIAFRAIPIGAGSHRVVWKYEPTWFKLGLAVSLLTALFLLAATIRTPRHGH